MILLMVFRPEDGDSRCLLGSRRWNRPGFRSDRLSKIVEVRTEVSRSREDRDEREGNAEIQMTGAKQVTEAKPIPSVSRRRKFSRERKFSTVVSSGGRSRNWRQISF